MPNNQANDGSQITNTNGWDLVSAIRFPDVNTAIIAQKSSPANFSETEDDDTFGQVSFSGDFGDWQLSGGDGKLVWIDMPLTNCKLNFMNKDHDYSKLMKATVEVNMLWVNQASKPNGYNLQVDDKVTVHVDSLDVGDNREPNGKEISTVLKSIMTAYLESWLKQHVSTFDHVFASVDIAEQADTADNLGWLKPTDKLYAVTSSDTDPDNLDKMIFAVLCMTEGRTNPGAHEVSPFAIPDGCRASFLISPERFLDKMMLPGMPLLFTEKLDGNGNWVKGITTDDFKVENLAIKNKVKMRFIKQEVGDDDKIVQPEIKAEKFMVRFHPNGVEMDMTDLTFEWSPGISVHIDHVAPAKMEIGPDRKFKLIVGNASTSASVKQSTGVMIAEIVGAVAASVIGAALGGIIGGAVSGGTEGAVQVAEAGAEAGSEAAIETITTTVDESVAGTITNISEEAGAEAGAETAAEEGGQALSKFGKFKLFFAKNWPKILGSTIGGSIGGSTGSIATIIMAVANDHDDVPTLDDLGTEALAPITWPNLEKDSFFIKNGGVNGCLQIGFDIHESN